MNIDNVAQLQKKRNLTKKQQQNIDLKSVICYIKLDFNLKH